MADLKTLMVYLCANYTAPRDLSNARLTKLVYLCDWENARASGRQMTDILWHFNHHGPWVPDISNLAYSDSAFEVKRVTNAFGSPKELIALREPARADLQPDEAQIADKVIAKTLPMYFGQFIDYVYGTYPIKHRPKYSVLDLKELAAEERQALLALLPRTDESGRVAAALETYVDSERGLDLPGMIRDVIELPDGFDEPTVEDIVLPDECPAPVDGAVTVGVDMLIDGFMEKSQAYAAEEAGEISFHDADWNEHYAWVYCEQRAYLTFDVSDIDSGGRADLVAAG